MNRTGVLFTAVLIAMLVVLAPVVVGAALPSLPVTVPGVAGLAKYMPKDATLIALMNVSKLAETGLFDTIEGMAGEDAFEDLEDMDIDIRKDITQVMFGLVVNSEDPEEEPGVYIAVAGTLPKEKLLASYEEEAGEAPEKTTVKGKTVYIMDETSVCFLPGVILMVPSDDGESDIANMLAGETNSVLANTTLAGLMKDANTKATIWGAASLSKALRDKIAEAEAEEAGEDGDESPLKFSALKTVVGSFDYADKTVLDVAIDFATKEAASTLVEMFDAQVKPLGAQMAEMMPAVAKLIGAVQMKADGSKAGITLNMSRADFDAGVKGLFGMMFGAMMGGMEGGPQ